MVEIFLFIFFLMVLGPIVVVLTYCGLTGHCRESNGDEQTSPDH